MAPMSLLMPKMVEISAAGVEVLSSKLLPEMRLAQLRRMSQTLEEVDSVSVKLHQHLHRKTNLQVRLVAQPSQEALRKISQLKQRVSWIESNSDKLLLHQVSRETRRRKNLSLLPKHLENLLDHGDHPHPNRNLLPPLTPLPPLNQENLDLLVDLPGSVTPAAAWVPPLPKLSLRNQATKQTMVGVSLLKERQVPLLPPPPRSDCHPLIDRRVTTLLIREQCRSTINI